MGVIRVMPEHLTNKIAAGEVVERPASVVKELVENGVDAGATRIDVEVAGRGCRAITVIDNGAGMEADDALLALERHATSKIYDDADLLAIRTLGFRGEALPSIAAVSHLELTTRSAAEEVGIRIQVSEGTVRQVSQCGCPVGTRVRVRELFFNQPARRKFLRSERTEFGHIVEVLLRLALARPQLHFTLRRQQRLIYEWPPTVDLYQRLAQVLPQGAERRWQPLEVAGDGIRISGLLSGAPEHRSSGNMLFFFVNGRPVRDRFLTAALMRGCRNILPKGRFPLGVVLVEAEPELVDVNVHPAKAEVRFRRQEQIQSLLAAAVASALKQRPAPPAAIAGHSPVPSALDWEEPRQERFWAREGGQIDYVATLAGGDEAGVAEAAAAGEHHPWTAPIRVIGQVQSTYIIGEDAAGLIFIDQHAAHERLLFEKLRQELTAGSLPRQRLTVPVPLECGGLESAWVEEFMPLLARLGFDLEPFGPHTYMVRAVPAVSGRQQPEEILADLIAAGMDAGQAPGPEPVLERLLQTMACTLAVKAGKNMQPQEIQALLAELQELALVPTCPHGRPWYWRLSLRDLARVFRRS